MNLQQRLAMTLRWCPFWVFPLVLACMYVQSGPIETADGGLEWKESPGSICYEVDCPAGYECIEFQGICRLESDNYAAVFLDGSVETSTGRGYGTATACEGSALDVSCESICTATLDETHGVALDIPVGEQIDVKWASTSTGSGTLLRIGNCDGERVTLRRVLDRQLLEIRHTSAAACGEASVDDDDGGVVTTHLLPNSFVDIGDYEQRQLRLSDDGERTIVEVLTPNGLQLIGTLPGGFSPLVCGDTSVEVAFGAAATCCDGSSVPDGVWLHMEMP